MKSIIDIPVYPSSLFLFPGEDLPLCAFDKSIIEIVNKAKENDMYFGLEFIGNENYQGVGTLVKLKSIVDTNKKGEMVVIVTGISYFKINYDKQYQSNYHCANVEILKLDDISYSFEIINLFKKYLKRQKNMDYHRLNSHLHLVDAMKAINLPSSEKFKFFVSSLKEKETIVFNHLRVLTQIQHCENELNDGYTLN